MQFKLPSLLYLFLIKIKMARDQSDLPIRNEERSCTDCHCLILFVAFTVAMLIIGIYSWTSGDFKKLTTGYDPDGKGCGVDHKDHPYVYFASPHYDSLWVTICVKKCPVEGDTSLDCKPNSVVTSCNAVNSANNEQAVQIYDSTVLGGKVCMATSDTIKEKITKGLGAGSATKIESLSKNISLVLLSFPIAIILSLLFMVLIRFTAGCFVYLLVFIVAGVLIAFGVFLITMNPSAVDSGTTLLQNKPIRIIIGAICLILAALICIMLCCFRKRLSLASSILKVSANFVSQHCLVILLPILLFFVLLVFLTLWILELLGYYSLGVPNSEPKQLPFQHFKTTLPIKILLFVHVFYLFWTTFFLVETGDFIIGGAAVSWYFKREDPYSESSERYRKYHIGSVCKGSFLLALIGFIKFLYEILTPQKTEETGCLSSYKKCCECFCCLCVSYLFKCFNNGAYAYVHIYSKSYCTSAFDVLALKLSNLITSGVVTILQLLFSVLIRVGITALTVFIVYLLAYKVPAYKETVKDGSLILILAGLIAFAISSLFLSVYSATMDCIFVSYLVDASNNTDNKCPEELREFIEEAEKAE